jgi:apolipoprotein N-acyltransferase
MVTPFGRLGAIICADLDYTDSAQHWGSLGTGILAVPSNDVGVKDHYTRIALRAVENRMSIVKADGGNDSAIVDPYGRIVKSIVLQHKGTALLVGDVAVGSGRTFVSRVGDWFGWVLLAGVAAMLVVGFVGRRHSRKV